MARTFNYLAVLALAGVALPAVAVTQAEVDEARNECRQHKLMVQSKGSFARDEDRRAWESACGAASAKMDELAGKEPVAVAAAAPAEPAAAQGEQAAFEAPAPATTSAYSYFAKLNAKHQAGGVAAAPAAPAAPTAPPENAAPDEGAAADYVPPAE